MRDAYRPLWEQFRTLVDVAPPCDLPIITAHLAAVEIASALDLVPLTLPPDDLSSDGERTIWRNTHGFYPAVWATHNVVWIAPATYLSYTLEYGSTPRVLIQLDVNAILTEDDRDVSQIVDSTLDGILVAALGKLDDGGDLQTWISAGLRDDPVVYAFDKD